MFLNIFNLFIYYLFTFLFIMFNISNIKERSKKLITYFENPTVLTHSGG